MSAPAAHRLNPQLKLATHPQFIDFLEGRKVYPINIEISPTHVCTATCPWCFWHNTHEKLGPNSILDYDIARKLITDFKDCGGKALTWSGGGEPTLHPQFDLLVLWASSHRLSQGMFTNALGRIKYNPSVFDWIRVSNTDRAWPVENLKLLRGKAKVLGLGYNYAGNDAEVYQALKVGKEVGVDYVQVRQALNLRGLVTERSPPQIDHPLLHLTKYKFEDSSQPHGYTKCMGYHFTPFVYEDGRICVCPYHREKGEPYTLGSLKEKSYKEIIDSMPHSVPVRNDCQVCCKNHETNKMLAEAMEVQDPHFV